ncbi:unnamed protein product [Cylicostephanus goldi]|uniref:Secreted protein n=1 Tax=Cylicostephanus goldi TaxID=71465 RepID=A0A3P7QHJ6_CYLGO|nr:unnamed protein product [Cylicostephanus goldi]
MLCSGTAWLPLLLLMSADGTDFEVANGVVLNVTAVAFVRVVLRINAFASGLFTPHRCCCTVVGGDASVDT